jgi:hypothetical protein
MSDLNEEETEVDETDEEVQETEESEDDTYIETLTEKVISELEDKIADYTNDPETPEEQASNDSIKKFIVQKVRNRLLNSFEDQFKWLDDADLISMLKKWKKVMAKGDDLDPSTAMTRIIKENNVIMETVEQQLNDMMETEEDEDGEEDVKA